MDRPALGRKHTGLVAPSRRVASRRGCPCGRRGSRGPALGGCALATANLGYGTFEAGLFSLPYDPTTGALLIGWVALALLGLLVPTLDPRPAFAAALLLPIVGVAHFAPTIATAITLGFALILTAGVTGPPHRCSGIASWSRGIWETTDPWSSRSCRGTCRIMN